MSTYWNSQWDHGIGELPWPESDKRRATVASLLEMAYKRYRKPIFLSETGHFGVGRAPWIDEITMECVEAINNGVELLGVCIYPVIDRPNWDNLLEYHDCGIWDMDQNKDRVPHTDSIAAILEGNKIIEDCLKQNQSTLKKVAESVSGIYHKVTDVLQS
jgi:beta-glucosidase/6-phospho-beta-glucosidase/beta-galactosidase